MSCQILLKNTAKSSKILINYNFKIYYIKCQFVDNLCLIDKIYMLEEIPNCDELNQRLQYYTNFESYNKVPKLQAQKYFDSVLKFLSLFIDGFTKKQLDLFDNLYGSGEFHPDLIDLYVSISQGCKLK